MFCFRYNFLQFILQALETSPEEQHTERDTSPEEQQIDCDNFSSDFEGSSLNDFSDIDSFSDDEVIKLSLVVDVWFS